MDQDEKKAREARDKLVMENLPLVHFMAGRFLGHTPDVDDLFQEGCIGLMKALEKYDPSRKIKFSTYAVPFILGEMRSFLRRSGHLLKVSRSFHDHSRQLYIKIGQLEQKLGRKPRMDELSAALQIPREEIAWLLELQKPAVSLDEEGLDGAAARTFKEDDFASEGYLQRLMLMDRIKTLPPRERQVIALRYFMEKTQEETATLLGISQSHVSRLERKVLQQMKTEKNDL